MIDTMSTRSTGFLLENYLEQPDMDDELQQGIFAAQAGDRARAYAIFQGIAEHYANSPEIWV